MQGVFEFYRDLPVRPRRPERLFFALLPDVGTAIHIAQFGQRFVRENRLEAKRLATERLHVSIHHVGDFKRLRTKFVYAAKQAGKAVSMSPFELILGSIKSFEGAPSTGGRPRGRPLVLLGESDALLQLHGTLGTAMERNGLRAAEHFVPHMTLSYGRSSIPERTIEPLHFRVKEFVLVHSRLWLTQYEIVDRWPLGN
ncbi:2'-5' RNA ligase family protein [Nitratireductor luteus]|uniref:2'-5' RNA ligase family protein n=1 Tax=Nitratireductor luteus TaxID=2976980 RepID=UPI00223F4010|nr:2'-5' RNA ligase family protein [Nitratireductor luteus]